MKSPKNNPPLRVGARLQKNREGLNQIEWSEVGYLTEDDPDAEGAGHHHHHKGFFQKFRFWIDQRIGAHKPEMRMLRRLHRTPKLEIVLPEQETTTSDGLTDQLHQYWKQSESRHKRLAVISAILLLPTTMLALLPGPNVLGLGVTYLLWHHWQIMRGIKRVRSGEIPVEIQNEKTVVMNPNDISDRTNI